MFQEEYDEKSNFLPLSNSFPHYLNNDMLYCCLKDYASALQHTALREDTEDLLS